MLKDMPICPEEGTSILCFCDKGILTATDDDKGTQAAAE